MKTLVILASLILGSTALAASRDKPTYTQCIVELPGNTVAGICKDVGEKHYQVLTCEGKGLAFVEPGALSRKDAPTCGPTHIGYQESLQK